MAGDAKQATITPIAAKRGGQWHRLIARFEDAPAADRSFGASPKMLKLSLRKK
jgi:hypothetical protein